jgi:hypothetical protein
MGNTRWRRGGIAVAAALVAAALLWAPGATVTAQECDESGYTISPVYVEGQFPAIVDGNSVFTYEIRGNGPRRSDGTRVQAISHVDIAVPNCAPPADPIRVIAIDKGGTLQGGDPSTGFGESDDTFDVIKWEISVRPNGVETVSFTVEGRVSVGYTQFLLKIASGYEICMVLGPSCANPSVAVGEGGITCDSSIASDGRSVDYTFSATVVNDGTTALTNVQASLEGCGEAQTVGDLAAGESTVVTFHCSSSTVRSGDVTLTVSGVYVDPFGHQTTVTAASSASVCPVDPPPSPGISLTYTCTGIRLVTEGERLVVKVCFQGAVTNGGNEALDGTVTAGGTEIPFKLGPGGSQDFAGCYYPAAPDAPALGDDAGFCVGQAAFTSSASATGTGAVSGETVSGESAGSVCDANSGCP